MTAFSSSTSCADVSADEQAAERRAGDVRERLRAEDGAVGGVQLVIVDEHRDDDGRDDPEDPRGHAADQGQRDDRAGAARGHHERPGGRREQLAGSQAGARRHAVEQVPEHRSEDHRRQELGDHDGRDVGLVAGHVEDLQLQRHDTGPGAQIRDGQGEPEREEAPAGRPDQRPASVRDVRSPSPIIVRPAANRRPLVDRPNRPPRPGGRPARHTGPR